MAFQFDLRDCAIGDYGFNLRDRLVNVGPDAECFYMLPPDPPVVMPEPDLPCGAMIISTEPSTSHLREFRKVWTDAGICVWVRMT